MMLPTVGIAQACLNASLQYARQHKQFGAYLQDHQLIAEMITEMITNVKAARLLCYQAGYSKDIGDPSTIMETWIAKYFASRIATRAASDAVQIHGANGCSDVTSTRCKDTCETPKLWRLSREARKYNRS